jgi:hypothetical protein
MTASIAASYFPIASFHSPKVAGVAKIQQDVWWCSYVLYPVNIGGFLHLVLEFGKGITNSLIGNWKEQRFQPLGNKECSEHDWSEGQREKWLPESSQCTLEAG